MIDWIVKCLKESSADAWEITDRKITGWEFYFIGHRLDQNRARDVENIGVKVYRKFDSFLGSAGTDIPVTASKEEVKEKIELLLEEAVLVRNPVYELNFPKNTETEKNTLPDLGTIAKDYIEVMKSIDETEGEYINSCELFAESHKVRYMNSNGIDVTSCYPSSLAEVVVNARNEAHEIELYRMYKSGTCDREYLKREIEETMRFGKDRLHTEKTPNLGSFDVVFSTDASLQLYEFFISRMSTNMIYRQFSDWKIGKPVAEFSGKDRLTIMARKSLPNSSKNCAFDAEGAPVRDLVVIEDGVARNYTGPRQYGQYLGREDTFIPGNFEVKGGSESEEDLRKGSFIEVVEFSDFQTDEITGNIAGEIRLAYLHENGTVRAVSGGSVSGTMFDFAKTMRFSNTQKQYDNRIVPAVTRLCGVTVTGA